MRILLAQNALYYPAYGGGDRSNRLLLEALAARGHQCRAVARIARFGAAGHAQYLRELAARAISPLSVEGGVVVFRLAGVEAHVVTHHPNLRAYFAAEIAAFAPDVILTSTDDPAQLLLEVSVRSDARTVYLARATLALPFGPDCAFPSAAKTEVLRQAGAVVGVSRGQRPARTVRTIPHCDASRILGAAWEVGIPVWVSLGINEKGPARCEAFLLTPRLASSASHPHAAAYSRSSRRPGSRTCQDRWSTSLRSRPST